MNRDIHEMEPIWLHHILLESSSLMSYKYHHKSICICMSTCHVVEKGTSFILPVISRDSFILPTNSLFGHGKGLKDGVDKYHVQ